jgi:hypothetical protein
MKLGLITVIHEYVEPLRTALDHFRSANVDQVVVIRDVFETGERIEETCRLLGEGRLAIFDTESSELQPFNAGQTVRRIGRKSG